MSGGVSSTSIGESIVSIPGHYWLAEKHHSVPREDHSSRLNKHVQISKDSRLHDWAPRQGFVLKASQQVGPPRQCLPADQQE